MALSPSPTSKGGWRGFRASVKAPLHPTNYPSSPLSSSEFEVQGNSFKKTINASLTSNEEGSAALPFLKQHLSGIFKIMGMDQIQITKSFAQIDFVLTTTQHEKLRYDRVLTDSETIQLKTVFSKMDTFIKEHDKERAAVMMQKNIRGFLIRKQKKNFKKEDISMLRIRNAKYFDLLRGTKKYISQIEKLINCYIKPLHESSLKGIDHCALFYLSNNFDTILKFEKKFQQKLLQVSNERHYPFTTSLGDVIVANISTIITNYSTYADNYQSALETYHYLQQSNAKFQALMNEMAKINNEKLEQCYELPLKRIPIFAKKLREIYECTIVFGKERESLLKGTEMLEVADYYVNSRIVKKSQPVYIYNIKKILAVELSFEGLDRPLRLLSAINRVLLKEGSVKINRKQHYVYLFNDLYIICEKQEKSLKFQKMTYLQHVTLQDLGPTKFSIIDLEEKSEENTEIFSCKGKSDKAEWFTVFHDSIENINKNRIFGVPLDQVVTRESNPEHIPNLINKTIQFLLEYGAKTEGIFRIPGDNIVVNDYKRLFDCGEADIDLHSCSVHDVAALLKLFLRQMPEPLFVYSVYNRLLEIYKPQEAREPQQLQNFAEIIAKLPKNNRLALRKLLAFLFHLATFSTQTKMGISNLALVFAPNIIRPEVDTVDTAMQSPTTIQIAELLIEKYHDIWEMAAEIDSSIKEEIALSTSVKNAIPYVPAVKKPPPPRWLTSETSTDSLPVPVMPQTASENVIVRKRVKPPPMLTSQSMIEELELKVVHELPKKHSPRTQEIIMNSLGMVPPKPPPRPARNRPVSVVPESQEILDSAVITSNPLAKNNLLADSPIKSDDIIDNQPDDSQIDKNHEKEEEKQADNDQESVFQFE